MHQNSPLFLVLLSSLLLYVSALIQSERESEQRENVLRRLFCSNAFSSPYVTYGRKKKMLCVAVVVVFFFTKKEKHKAQTQPAFIVSI